MMTPDNNNPNDPSSNKKSKVQFDKQERLTFKQSLNQFWIRMTTPGSSYSQSIKNMNPQEVIAAREKLRTRIKYGSYSFVFLVMTGYALYSKYLGTEESRLRYNIKQYLAKEQAEVEKLRKEVSQLERDYSHKIKSGP